MDPVERCDFLLTQSQAEYHSFVADLDSAELVTVANHLGLEPLDSEDKTIVVPDLVLRVSNYWKPGTPTQTVISPTAAPQNIINPSFSPTSLDPNVLAQIISASIARTTQEAILKTAATFSKKPKSPIQKKKKARKYLSSYLKTSTPKTRKRVEKHLSVAFQKTLPHKNFTKYPKNHYEYESQTEVQRLCLAARSLAKKEGNPEIAALLKQALWHSKVRSLVLETAEEKGWPEAMALYHASQSGAQNKASTLVPGYKPTVSRTVPTNHYSSTSQQYPRSQQSRYPPQNAYQSQPSGFYPQTNPPSQPNLWNPPSRNQTNRPRSRNPQNAFRGNCWNCNLPGHTRSQCPN